MFIFCCCCLLLFIIYFTQPYEKYDHFVTMSNAPHFIITHQQMYVCHLAGKNTSNGMVFYNAKQNGVARKYYQKSRRAATRKCLTMNNKAQSDCETGDLFKPQKTLSNDFHLVTTTTVTTTTTTTSSIINKDFS